MKADKNLSEFEYMKYFYVVNVHQTVMGIIDYYFDQDHFDNKTLIPIITKNRFQKLYNDLELNDVFTKVLISNYICDEQQKKLDEFEDEEYTQLYNKVVKFFKKIVLNNQNEIYILFKNYLLSKALNSINFNKTNSLIDYQENNI